MKHRAAIKARNLARDKASKAINKVFYSADHLYHIEKHPQLRGLKARPSNKLWEESLCGKMIQFGRMEYKWPWCPKCWKALDKETNREPTPKEAKTRRPRKVIEQRFEATQEILERIAKYGHRTHKQSTDGATSDVST